MRNLLENINAGHTSESLINFNCEIFSRHGGCFPSLSLPPIPPWELMANNSSPPLPLLKGYGEWEIGGYFPSPWHCIPTLGNGRLAAGCERLAVGVGAGAWEWQYELESDSKSGSNSRSGSDIRSGVTLGVEVTA